MSNPASVKARRMAAPEAHVLNEIAGGEAAGYRAAATMPGDTPYLRTNWRVM
ncbi:hypothetical protein ACUXPM_000512 [Ralstonia sp. 151470066-2]|jgi:hypothetical protein